MNLKAQDERPATAETMTDSGDVAVVEPLAVPIPAVASAAENTASIRNVQEVTQTPPQLPSSAPQVAENIVHPTLPPENVMNQSPPVMTVDLPPQAPEVGNNIEHSSPLAGAPPPIEHTLPHGAFQGEEGQPLVEETSVEFATPAPSDQNQLSNQGTPSTA